MAENGHGRSNKKMSRRCHCGKLGKDIIDGEVLCRIHSPMRKGFEEAQKKERKMEKNK